MREGVYGSLYWTSDWRSQRKADAVFLFFNEDESVIVGVGKRLNHIRETQSYFQELARDLNIVAGYVTVGMPADSKESFLSAAQASQPPKVIDGIVIER